MISKIVLVDHQGWVLTPEPWLDNHVSFGLNVSNFEQDRNPRSSQVWLVSTPISISGQMLRNDVLVLLKVCNFAGSGHIWTMAAASTIVIETSQEEVFSFPHSSPLSDNNDGYF